MSRAVVVLLQGINSTSFEKQSTTTKIESNPLDNGIAARWASPHSKGIPFCISPTSGLAIAAKFRIKIQSTLQVPKNPRTCVRFSHSDQSLLFWILASCGTTFGGALVTDNGGVRSGEDEFLSRNSCVNVLEALEDSVDNGEMFPDK